MPSSETRNRAVPKPDPDSLYLSTWNHAGVPIFLGFCGAPAILLGISWYWFTGRAAAEIVDGFGLADGTELRVLLRGYSIRLAKILREHGFDLPARVY